MGRLQRSTYHANDPTPVPLYQTHRPAHVAKTMSSRHQSFVGRTLGWFKNDWNHISRLWDKHERAKAIASAVFEPQRGIVHATKTLTMDAASDVKSKVKKTVVGAAHVAERVAPYAALAGTGGVALLLIALFIALKVMRSGERLIDKI